MKSEIIKDTTNKFENIQLIKLTNFNNVIVLVNFDVENEYGTVIHSSDKSYSIGERLYLDNEQYVIFNGEIKLSN